MKSRGFSHDSMRSSNCFLILKTVKEHGPISRASISRLTGLTKSTVSEIVSDLIGKGILKEVGYESGKIGRKGILVNIDYTKFSIIGCDVGTTEVRIVLTDLEGNIHDWITFPTERIDAIGNVVNAVESMVNDRVVGLGFGIPGMVDRSTGVIVHAPNLDLKEYPLMDVIKSRIGGDRVIVLDHSVKAMLKAEVEIGAARGRKNVLLLNIGPGVGCAFSSEGLVVRGAHNFTGEIGHLKVVDDGDECSCGKKGCLETVASAWGIVKNYNKLTGEGVDYFDSKTVAKRAKSGDAIALKVFENAGFFLGKAVANVANIVDPEIIILGGGLTKAWDLMKNRFNDVFRENLIHPLKDKIEIKLSSLGDKSTALGAVIMTVEKFLETVC